MNYIFFFIFSFVLTTVAMESSDNSSNDTFDYILPFLPDNSLPLNAINEINTLAREGTPKSAYRDELLDPFEQGKGKNEKKNDQDRKSSDLMEQFPNMPLGTVPFKQLIHCGIGYTALLTVALDCYFFYKNSYEQPKKKCKKKIYQANNVVNICYVLNMLNQVSATCMSKMVDELHANYINNILLPKAVTAKTYTNNAQIAIESKDIRLLRSYCDHIDQLITYKNNDLLYAHVPLKYDATEALLQLLLQLYTFWKHDSGAHIIKVLPDHMNLFLEVSKVKHMVENNEDIHSAFNTLIAQMELVLQPSVDCLDEELAEIKQDKENKKYVIVHNFLCVLNRYVYQLISVPVATEKNNRIITGVSTQPKKKKNINADPNSFFEKHKEAVKITKYIGLTVLIVGLLYRLVKNNQHLIVSKSHF